MYIGGFHFGSLEVYAIVAAENNVVHERHMRRELDEWVILLLKFKINVSFSAIDTLVNCDSNEDA